MEKSNIVEEYVEQQIKNVSEQLRLSRIRKGYTVEDVISLTKINKHQIYKIENGQKCRLINYIKLGLLYGYRFEKILELYPDIDFELPSFDLKSELLNQKIREYVSNYKIKFKDMESLGVSFENKRRIKKTKLLGINILLNYMFFIPDLDLTDIFK